MYTRKSSMYTYTGWRRLIGSPKLHIIFHKRAAKYRSLLRKMTYKDKGSYESSPPCIRPLSSSTSISLCRLCIHVFIHMYINTHIHKRKRSIYIHIRPAYRQPLYAMYTSAHTYRYSHTCTYEKAARIWPERILAAPVVTLYMAIYTSIHIDVYTCTRTHLFDIQQHTYIHLTQKNVAALIVALYIAFHKSMHVQPIADRMALNLGILLNYFSKKPEFCPWDLRLVR